MENVTLIINNGITTVAAPAASAAEVHAAPEWMVQFVEFRKRLFLRTVEPIIVAMLGPVVAENETSAVQQLPPSLLSASPCPDCYHLEDQQPYQRQHEHHYDDHHRRLGFLPEYVSNVNAYKETSMSFASLIMLFVTLSCVFLIFLSCFYHSQKTSPLFISPRRHRLPRLVPPPLPVDGYFSWVKICLFLSDEEIINRIGYDSLIFLRFHRLALRCIVKMSVFSFVVLLPLNFTGGGHAKAQDLKEYVGSLFFTDFLRFTMANVVSGSPRLWVHCFAAYLLTGIVCRELLIEYETFNSIRHRYLLSREPHLRTVLVTNIPRHLRSSSKISNYFRHVYPDAVRSVFMCQNLIHLERLIQQRTKVLSKIEQELLILCRTEKRKLYEPSTVMRQCLSLRARMEDCGLVEGSQERLAKFYVELEQLNGLVEQEQRRRRRVMKVLDKMEAGEGSADIDYVLASPFFVNDDPHQRRVLGLDQQGSACGKKRGDAKASGKSSRPPDLENNNSIEGHEWPESIPEGNEENCDETLIGSVEVDETGNESTTNGTNRLRSRSPASPASDTAPPMAAGGGAQRESDHPDVLKGNGGEVGRGTRRKRLQRSFAKARRAIQQYSRFNRDVSFLGRPVRSLTDGRSENVIEDHINEVTDKAFVVMRTFTAATIAIQSMHSSKPGSMQVSTAPEPRDILWNNIYVSKGARRTRTYLGEILVLLIITFYIVPVALVSLLVSESALISSSPRLAQLDQASAFFSASISLVQPLCIVGLQQLLPPLFILIGEAEGITSFSEVQMRAFSRYFLFQVVNVFLVTTIAGSIFDTVSYGRI